MRIAVDAMGGDDAPRQVVDGVAEVVNDRTDAIFVLVGDTARVQAELDRHGIGSNGQVEIEHASQVIEMDEPLSALRSKEDSSIVRAVRLVKEGGADALVAFGNTAAAVAATTLYWRLLPGVRRAGIALPMPSKNGATIIIDVGANIQAKPKHLVNYAVMASVHCKALLGVDVPRVGLLNVGEELSKGNGDLKATFKLLQEAPVNFIGNVEGRDIFNGSCDVVVCDGFVGNVVLKCIEGAASFVGHMLKEEIVSSPLRVAGGLLCKSALDAVKDKCDYSTYGGVPLLGVNGVCIIGHGSSGLRATANALRVAARDVAGHVNQQIVELIGD